MTKAKYKAEFKKIFKLNGFKPAGNGSDYINNEYGWYAEIIDRGVWCDVWMVGKGLKDSSFPGGWLYDEPEEVWNALSDAILYNR